MNLQFLQALKEATLHERRVLGNEIQQLETTLGSFLLGLTSIMPEHSAYMQELAENMKQRMEAIRNQGETVEAYFSGNGPLARKLKEHSQIYSWMLQRIHGGYDGGTTRLLAEKLTAFDFHPVREASLVQAVRTFLQRVRQQVDDGEWTTPQPPLVGQTLANVKTGIYGEGPDSSRYTVVLRTHTPQQRGFEIAFISIPGLPPALYYWHPYEMEWVQDNGQVTFNGVLEKLEREFQLAMAQADQLGKGFVFDDELKKLTTRSITIFERDAVLPRVRVQHRPSRRPEVIYRKEAFEGAEIVCRTKDMALIIRSSRGLYAFQSASIVMYAGNDDNVVGAVGPEQVPRHIQRELIQRANQVFSFLINEINLVQANRATDVSAPHNVAC